MQTHLEFGAPVQASRQQLAGLDGDRRQLPLAFQNVSNGVDVGHIGLLLIVHWNFSIPGGGTVRKKKALFKHHMLPKYNHCYPTEGTVSFN